MRRCIWCVWLLFLLLSGTAAQALTAQHAFRISFRDKQGAPSISNPSVFLSVRALNRRAQQGIAVDSIDRPVSPDYIDSVLATTGGILHLTSRWLNNCVILLEDSSKILLLQNKPFITDIEYVAYYPNGLHNKAAIDNKFKNEPTVPGYKPTGTQAYYNNNWPQTTLVHGDCLHDKGLMGQGKLIAVLDDGFTFVDNNPAFDSLYTSGRILDTHNFVQDTGFVYGYFAHGTEVLSTLAVFMPNTYVGASPLAQYALYITEDQASEQLVEMDNMVAGMERADSVGADIVSSSLGYNDFLGPTPYSIPLAQLDGKTTITARATNIATSRGMLMVISAGNEGASGLLTPGDADSALTIGNVDANKLPAGTSGTGPNAAGHIKPDVCALGNPAAVMRNTTSVFFVSGTSLSTPQIAGYAACLMQSLPAGKKPYEIKNAIRKAGHAFSNPSNPQLGYGVPDFCVAWQLMSIPQLPKEGGHFAEAFPNPFHQGFSIRLNEVSPALKIQVQITDVTGALVWQGSPDNKGGVLDIELPASVTPGIYYCRLVQDQYTAVLKLVKD